MLSQTCFGIAYHDDSEKILHLLPDGLVYLLMDAPDRPENSKSLFTMIAVSSVVASMFLWVLDFVLHPDAFSVVFALQSLCLFVGTAGAIAMLESLVVWLLLRLPVSNGFRVLAFAGVGVVAAMPFLKGYFSALTETHPSWALLALPVSIFVVLIGLIMAGFLSLKTAKGAIWAGLILLAVGLAAGWADLNLLQDLYLPVHWVLVFLFFLGIQGLAAPIFYRWRPKISARALWSVTFLLLIPYFTFLRTNAQRETALDHTNYLKILVQIHGAIWDLDGDGYSYVLGNGDKNDLDPSVIYGMKNTGKNFRIPCPFPKSNAMKSPNGTPVILITFDALSRQVLLSNKQNWPNLRFLYDSGFRFANAYAPGSSTHVSFPMLFAGRYDPKQAKTPDLATALGKAGYYTIALVPHDIPEIIKKYSKPWKKDPFSPFQYGMDFLKNFQHRIVLKSQPGWLPAKATALASINLLKKLEKSNRPFFVWIHFYDTHDWFKLSGQTWAYAWTHPMTSYTIVLRRMDPWVGRLVSYLKTSGLMDRAVVIMTADHGEALGHKGYRTHSIWTYNCLVHVPLSVHIPNVKPGVSVVPIGLVDLYPTILSVLGITPPAGLDGCDMTPAFQHARLANPHPLFFTSRKEAGMVMYPYKLSFAFTKNIQELYDVSRDPDENTNLWSSKTTLARRMFTMLKSFLAAKYPGALR